jgi:hypothetical protein
MCGVMLCVSGLIGSEVLRNLEVEAMSDDRRS